MLKTEKLKNNKEKVDQYESIISWSTGLSIDQIAKNLGVSTDTVLRVKADLNQNKQGKLY